MAMESKQRAFEVRRVGDDLAAGLGKALALYRQRHGKALASVVVAAKNADAARADAERLAAPHLSWISRPTAGKI